MKKYKAFMRLYAIDMTLGYKLINAFLCISIGSVVLKNTNQKFYRKKKMSCYPLIDFCRTDIRGNFDGSQRLSIVVSLYELLSGLDVITMQSNYELFIKDEIVKNIHSKMIWDKFFFKGWLKNYWCFEDIEVEKNRKIFDKYGVSYVIGFELSPGWKMFMDLLNVKYLDFRISPYKFSEYLFLDCYSNDIELYEKLQKVVTVSKKSRLIDYYPYTLKEPVENSLLIVGQTKYDASVICENKKFVSLLDYRDSLQELFVKYEKIYYKPHPVGGLKSLKIKSYDIINLNKANVYKLIAGGVDVVSVSSGVLDEFELITNRKPYRLKTKNSLLSVVDKLNVKSFLINEGSRFINLRDIIGNPWRQK